MFGLDDVALLIAFGISKIGLTACDGDVYCDGFVVDCGADEACVAVPALLLNSLLSMKYAATRPTITNTAVINGCDATNPKVFAMSMHHNNCR